MKYRTIVADPPWPYRSPGRIGASLEHRPNRDRTAVAGSAGSVDRYGSMSLAEICALSIDAENDAHLYLWTTNAFVEQAHGVARAWGFTPKTLCTWGKVQANGNPSMKMGYYFRGATEHCLFCVRGSLPPQTDDAIPTLWLWPRGRHSEKPDAFFDMVEEVSPGPYLELFARRQRLGWDTWGNECFDHTMEVRDG